MRVLYLLLTAILFSSSVLSLTEVEIENILAVLIASENPEKVLETLGKLEKLNKNEYDAVKKHASLFGIENFEQMVILPNIGRIKDDGRRLKLFGKLFRENGHHLLSGFIEGENGLLQTIDRFLDSIYEPDMRIYLEILRRLNRSHEEISWIRYKYHWNNIRLAGQALQELKNSNLSPSMLASRFVQVYYDGNDLIKLGMWAYFDSTEGSIVRKQIHQFLISGQAVPNYERVQIPSLFPTVNRGVFFGAGVSESPKASQIRTKSGSLENAYVERVAADGDCLFSALGITRREFIDKVLARFGNGDRELDHLVGLMLVEDRTPENEDIKERLTTWGRQFDTKGRWGGGVHIAIFTRLFERRVELFKYSEGNPEVLVRIQGVDLISSQQTSENTLYLVYDGVHYDRVIVGSIPARGIVASSVDKKQRNLNATKVKTALCQTKNEDEVRALKKGVLETLRAEISQIDSDELTRRVYILAGLLGATFQDFEFIVSAHSDGFRILSERFPRETFMNYRELVHQANISEDNVSPLFFRLMEEMLFGENWTEEVWRTLAPVMHSK